MEKGIGFKKFKRETPKRRPVEKRIKDFNEIYEAFPDEKLKIQAERCMNCGTPFCNWACPLGNLAPDFNKMVHEDKWEKAFRRLMLTTNFPEFTGRVCPALCEGSCTLGVNREPVTVREIELAIIERAFKEGWVKPTPPRVRTGMKVAVVGSGPAGLSAAAYLNALGHYVTVVERDDEIGGLLRLGIPDFKLEKSIVDRRIKIMEQEGIVFKTNVNVGVNYKAENLLEEYNAVILAGGSTIPRDLPIEGRELEGIYFAVDFLKQQNRVVSGKAEAQDKLNAKDKVVVVIGGGDTGSDCIGTAVRQGAKAVYQYEIMPKPPEMRDETMMWPEYPRTIKTTSSHEEGCIRDWCISTKKVIGHNGKIKTLQCVKVQWEKNESGRLVMNEVPGTEFEQKADMVLIAMGFLHPQHEGMLKNLNLQLDLRGNVKTNENNMASMPGIFAAGDMRTGQSLVVKAISDGRTTAKQVDKYLMLQSNY